MSDSSIPDEWYFITAPQEVNWSKDAKFKTIDTYGTNNPYLNYGSTSLRTLSLGDAMLEGFSDAKEVEGNIGNLESCMRMIIDEGSGFTSPYCWNVFAADKSYGTYIITSVSVDEKMRDMTGKATRAHVSVELQEVPGYQVTSGIDITSTAVVGGITPESEAALQASSEAAKQDSAVAKSKSAGGTNSTGQSTGGGGSSSGGGGSGGGSGTGSSTQAQTGFSGQSDAQWLQN
jgi:uncharacterized membrane protein YgcG